jgi:hypothetical protein
LLKIPEVKLEFKFAVMSKSRAVKTPSKNIPVEPPPPSVPVVEIHREYDGTLTADYVLELIKLPPGESQFQ